MTALATEQTTVCVNAATLVAAVKDALRAVPSRPHTPILSGLRMHAESGLVVVSGFDYETSITRTVFAAGDVEPFVVPGIMLRDALARLDQKQDVTISVADVKVTLTQGTRVVSLKTLPLDEYPDLPKAPESLVFETTGGILTELTSALNPFVGKDDQLPVLTAVNLRLDGNMLHGGATDRFRAALIIRQVVAHVEDFNVLVTRLPIIAAVIGKAPHVAVHLDGGTIAFVSDDTVITQRVLDGQFPKLAGLFPTDPITVTTFEPLAFLSAVKFVEAGVERNCAITVVVTAEGIAFEGGGDDSTHTDSVPAVVVGDDLHTGFNPAFLTDAVKVFGKGHDVVMSSREGTKPSMFESESIPDLRVLLMPRRLLS